MNTEQTSENIFKYRLFFVFPLQQKDTLRQGRFARSNRVSKTPAILLKNKEHYLKKQGFPMMVRLYSFYNSKKKLFRISSGTVNQSKKI